MPREDQNLPIDDIRAIARIGATIEELRRKSEEVSGAHVLFAQQLATLSGEVREIKAQQQSMHDANQTSISEVKEKLDSVAATVATHEEERQQEIGKRSLRTWVIGLASSSGGGGFALALSRLLGGPPPGH